MHAGYSRFESTPCSFADRETFTDEEREFITAVDRFKRQQRKPFPTWREILKLVKDLGYEKKRGD